MGASGASRGCPTRDSGTGASSGRNFSAFAVGGDCTPRLAVKTDILVRWRFLRPRRPVGQSGGVGTNTNTGQGCQRWKEKQRIAEGNKGTAYYLVKVKSLRRVLLCRAEEEE